MAKLTDAEIEEMGRRTTDISLFKFAEAYLSCGKTLTSKKISGMTFSDLIFYMRYHAIELYLKAYLRLKGKGAYQLGSWAYGHNLVNLSTKAARSGWRSMPETPRASSAYRHISLSSIAATSKRAIDRWCRLRPCGQPPSGLGTRCRRS
jgi:hypothetical protein